MEKIMIEILLCWYFRTLSVEVDSVVETFAGFLGKGLSVGESVS